MTLICSTFAAIVCTIIWYKSLPKNELRIDILCWMYWGASIMWLVDAIYEFVELQAEYFTPAPEDMLNDAFLGLSVIAFALVVWVVRLLILDPKGVIKKALTKNNIKEDKEVVTQASSK